MMKAIVLAVIALGATAQDVSPAANIETAAKTEAKGKMAAMNAAEAKAGAKGTYTVSAQALAAKVKMEAEKVEKARVAASSYSLADEMKSAESMSQADRLKEMAMLVDADSEGEERHGTNIVKALSAEAKESLAKIQHMFTKSTAGMLEKLGQVKMVSIHPDAEKEVAKSLSPVEEELAPMKQLLEDSSAKHPELKPFTSKVGLFSSFFDKAALEDHFASPLKDFQKYKKQFVTYTPEHQAQIEDFMEMFQMDDILTVIRSPEL